MSCAEAARGVQTVVHRRHADLREPVGAAQSSGGVLYTAPQGHAGLGGGPSLLGTGLTGIVGRLRGEVVASDGKVLYLGRG